MLQIGIIGDCEGWHARQLKEAALKRGHMVDAIDFRRLACKVGVAASPLWPQSSKQPDAFIVRSMPAGTLEQVIFRMNMLGQAQAAGSLIVNPPRSLEVCIDKFLASAVCAQAGLAVPALEVSQTAEQALESWHRLGEDTIVKPLFGSEGRGMIRVSDEDMAWRVFTTIERLGQVIYLQEFVPHPGWDLRILVLDGQILGGIKRHGHGHWRTNVAKGGKAESCEAPEEAGSIALKACAATGVVFGGVDLLLDRAGRWLLLEVNGVPGFRAFQRATGLDVATLFVEYLEKQSRAKHPPTEVVHGHAS